MSAIKGSKNSNPLHLWVLGQGCISLKSWGHGPVCIVRGPNFQGSTHQWETGCTESHHLGVLVWTCCRRVAARQEVVR